MYKNKEISAIVAIGVNNEIGYKNKLLCYISSDLKRFKKLTTGNTIIMGRKTFESLPKGALPNRTNIVVSRNSELSYPNCTMANSIEEAIEKAEKGKEIFIIGGEQIYKQSFEYIDKIYLTKIPKTFNADAYFPKIDFSKWETIHNEKAEKAEKDECEHTFLILKKLN